MLKMFKNPTWRTQVFSLLLIVVPALLILDLSWWQIGVICIGVSCGLNTYIKATIAEVEEMRNG